MTTLDRVVTFVGFGALVSALGCGGGMGDPNASTGGSGGTALATGGQGTGGASSGGGPASGGSSGSGGTPGPTEPYTIDGGSCIPNPMPGPEPIYDNTDTFAHIDAMAAYGDDLIFVESYDFNDPPPRIAKLDAAGTVATILDAPATALAVYGDNLYFVDTEGLKTLDLADASSTPESQTLVTGILAFDDQRVVYSTDTNLFAIEIGLQEDTSSAVSLGSPGETLRNPAISGDALYYHDVDNIFALALDGSGLTQVTPNDQFRYIWRLVVDDTHAYYDDAPLKAIPLAGGEATTLGQAGPDGFSGRAGFVDLKPAGDLVYWSDDNESWGWTAKDGMSCGILGLHRGFFGGAVAVSESYVYARGDSELYRIERVDQ